MACSCSWCPSSVDIQSRFLNDIAGMANKINCSTHGETEEAFVCSPLLGDSVGRGFNRKDPNAEHPFPDAGCDDCELIRTAPNGGYEESERLLKISLLCSGCYERSRIRNSRPSFTLANLKDFRWKCGRCEEWHTGPAGDNPKRVELPPMFSWLSSLIPDYPETLGLKMYARIRRADWRPYFDLEPSEHPLSIEQRCGIAPERIQQIMIARLGNNQ